MGLFFELVVNFGLNEAEMAVATDLTEQSTVQVRDVTLPLKSPVVTPFRSEEQQLIYFEFTTWPLGISHPRGAGTFGDADLFPPFKAQELSDQELSAVGEQLYDVLSASTATRSA